MALVYDLSSCSKFESSAVLTSICLFPKSKEKRDEYLAILFSHCLVVLDKLIKSSDVSDPEGLNKQYRYIESLKNKYIAPSVIYELFCNQNTSKFVKNISERAFMFSVVGNILDMALMKNVSVGRAAILYCEAFQEQAGMIPYLLHELVSKINKDEGNISSNIWPEFQDVAHLSAAMIHLSPPRNNMEDGSWKATVEPFNFHIFCNHGTSNAPATLEGFLSLAEGYRQAGIQYKCPKSSKFLMSEEKSWQIKPFIESADLFRPSGD